jgi:hypothetical protein
MNYDLEKNIDPNLPDIRYYDCLYDNYLILKLFYEIRSTAAGNKIFFVNNIYLDKRGEVA